MTVPTEAMWEAMRRVEPGWTLFDEDKAVNELETLGAQMLGKEAALFVPTCSMANLLALMTLGQRGTQVILEATSHIALSEEAGLAYVCGLYPRLLPGVRGIPPAEAVEQAIARTEGAGTRPPRTSLVCLENSHNNAGGAAIPVEAMARVAEVAHRYDAAVHVDGARLFNAAAALGVRPADLAQAADSVSVSLNKGLCAPQGALLCGNREMVARARVNARRIGAGSLHKAGILAAAGIIALTQMVGRLAEDHVRAKHLAGELGQVEGLRVDPASVQTNIVLVEIAKATWSASRLVEALAERGVLALARSSTQVRFVTHESIDDTDVEYAAQAVRAAWVMAGAMGN